jgi:hypothetical protein
MAQPLRLSGEVLEFIDDLDRSFVEQYPDDGAFLLKRSNLIAEVFRLSRQVLTDNFISVVEDHAVEFPESVTADLDSLYVRELVAAVPEYVERTIALSHLSAGRKPPKRMNKYLGEAVRAYILGLPLASIAISRAALEQGINDCLTSTPEDAAFSAKIDQIVEALGIDESIGRTAKQVVRKCNSVIHEGPVGLPVAFEILVKVRIVLEALYSTDPAQRS